MTCFMSKGQHSDHRRHSLSKVSDGDQTSVQSTGAIKFRADTTYSACIHNELSSVNIK